MITVDTKDRAFLMWAAAWLDTEGSIGMRSDTWDEHRKTPAFRLRIDVSQVVREPLDVLCQAFGGMVTGPHTLDRRKPIYRFIIVSQRAAIMLRLVAPYLMVKQRQAALAIEAAELVASHRKGRFHRRPDEITERLYALKSALNELNGWTPDRIAKARIIGKRRGPQPLTRWCRDHDACRQCGTTETRHAALGLCRTCYMTAYNRAAWLKHGIAPRHQVVG